MKIVLSRKGFDSSTGGVASPILPDGTMLSLPIPYPGARHRLGDITRHGLALGPLVSALTRGRLGPDTAVHLDPDLVDADRPRQPEWRGAFGQLGAAQSHLAAEGVAPGDLFLFFGWFRATERIGAGWRFQRDAPDVHALFGWLQVGEILRVGPAIDEHRRRRPWLADHPHLNGHAVPGNTVYVAARALQIAGRSLGVPGAGVFPRYHAGLRLSAPGCTRSVWTLPAWMLPARGPALSYHRDPSRWSEASLDRVALRTVAQGQEFVLDCAADLPALRRWLTAMLPGSSAISISPGASDALGSGRALPPGLGGDEQVGSRPRI